MRYTIRGFTLIELMVAISIMAVMAVASWRGIDGMARAQSATRAHADQIVTLQTALAQWQTDLSHMHETQIVNAIDYDGRALRITRRDSASDALLRVVAWTRRSTENGSRWLRWQSPPFRTRAELQAAWTQAAQWAQTPTDSLRKSEVELARIDDLQIFYFRNNAWVNPQSSGAVAGAAAVAVVTAPPDGVRLVLKLSEQQALTGTLTQDWVRPIF
jgi:general secretion pathway protein J